MILPKPTTSSDGGTWAASPETKEQVWIPRLPTPSEKPWSASPTITRQEPSVTTESHSSHNQAWQVATPPQEYLWRESTASPVSEMLKTPSPPHQHMGLWSPESESFESWKHIPDTSTQYTSDHIYNLPISTHQDQSWYQEPVATPISYTGNLIADPVHDPSQPWTVGFEGPEPSWAPKTTAEYLDMLHGMHKPSMMGSQRFGSESRYNKGVGV